MDASKCPKGHVSVPRHPRCPECGEPQVASVDLSEEIGTVVTWTRATTTPPGVRTPNTLAVVEFDVDGETVRAVAQVEADEIRTGDEVALTYVERLSDPEASMKDASAQRWDGYRVVPVDR